MIGPIYLCLPLLYICHHIFTIVSSAFLYTSHGIFHFYRYFILLSKIISLLISILFCNVLNILKLFEREKESLLIIYKFSKNGTLMSHKINSRCSRYCKRVYSYFHQLCKRLEFKNVSDLKISCMLSSMRFDESREESWLSKNTRKIRIDMRILKKSRKSD